MAVFTITPDKSVFTSVASDHAFDNDSAAADTLIVQNNAFLLATGTNASGALLRKHRAVDRHRQRIDLRGRLLRHRSRRCPGASTITVGVDGEVGGGFDGIVAGGVNTYKTPVSLSADDIGIVLFGASTILNTSTGSITGGGKDAIANLRKAIQTTRSRISARSSEGSVSLAATTR